MYTKKIKAHLWIAGYPTLGTFDIFTEGRTRQKAIGALKSVSDHMIKAVIARNGTIGVYHNTVIHENGR